MHPLLQYGIIPTDYASLKASYPSLKSFKDKISDLESRGEIIRLKRGIYIVSPAVSGKEVSVELIANHLYGPSYLSMESALRFHGLIPENVPVTFSMTLKRGRSFKNLFGQFEYVSCPEDYYPIGISQVVKNGISFLMASPEKALCDLIVYTPKLRLRSVKLLQLFMEEDLRFDMAEFRNMNIAIFEQCVERSKKKADIYNLVKLLKR
jgi:hypothetical protein